MEALGLTQPQLSPQLKCVLRHPRAAVLLEDHLLSLSRPTIFLALAFSLYGQGVQYTFNSSGVQTLSYNGQSFIGADTTFTMTSAVFGGATITYSSPTRSIQASGFSARYRSGLTGDTDFVVTLSGSGTDVFEYETCVTNNDTSSRALESMDSHNWFSLAYPGTVTLTADNPDFPYAGERYQAAANSISYTGAGGGTVTCYENNYSEWYSICSAVNGRARGYNAVPIAFGQTKCVKMFVKFGQSGSYILSEAFPGYQDWWSRYPMAASWPDRRMIFADFISIQPTDRSVSNPFAYCGTGVDAYNSSTLSTCLVSRANSEIALVNTYKNTYGFGTQGIILWDYEGYEFRHATTYQGDPRAFTNGYSPIGAVLNTAIDVYLAAGLRVGFTIRPQTIDYVTVLTPTCLYNVNPMLNQVAIVVTDSWPNRFYACESGDVWSASGVYPDGTGYQLHYSANQDSEITAILRDKITYAIQNFRATMFYIDTMIYGSGSTIDYSVLRTLQSEFPGVLIIPEQETSFYYRYASSYRDPSNTSDYPGTPSNYLRMTPGAFSFTKMQNCSGSCWTAKGSAAQDAMGVGEVMSTWVFQDAAMTSNLGSAWVNSVSQYSHLTVTDTASGSVRNFKAAPKTAFTYPLELRVYFASTANDLAASTTYCASGKNPHLAEDLGLLAIKGSNACSISLSGLPYYQIRYYDFAGNQVSEGPYATLQ